MTTAICFWTWINLLGMQTQSWRKKNSHTRSRRTAAIIHTFDLYKIPYDVLVSSTSTDCHSWWLRNDFGLARDKLCHADQPFKCRSMISRHTTHAVFAKLRILYRYEKRLAFSICLMRILWLNCNIIDYQQIGSWSTRSRAQLFPWTWKP
jgi:hypothetical protein